MLQKIANIAFIICGVSISIPQLFILFNDGQDALLNKVPWGIILLITGSIGLLLQLSIAIKEKRKFTFSTFLLLSTFIVLMLGFSLKQFFNPWANYFLLAGVLLLGTWLVIPSKRVEQED